MTIKFRVRCYDCRKKLDNRGSRCKACEIKFKTPPKKNKSYKVSRWMENPVNPGMKYQVKPIKEKVA